MNVNEIFQNSATLGVVLSLLSYQLGLFLKKKFKKDIFNPLLISIIITICFLLSLNVKYESYNNSAKYLSYLLTPATVSLAVPLFEQISLLKKNFKAIILGILAGTLASLSSIFILSKIFNLSHGEYVTLLPKSITSAIGIGVSAELGGYITISVATIVITGVFGNLVAQSVCKVFSIKYAISRGIAIGTSSHAIGTAKAIEMGEEEGAMSSLAIVITGLFTVVGASIFAGFI